MHLGVGVLPQGMYQRLQRAPGLVLREGTVVGEHGVEYDVRVRGAVHDAEVVYADAVSTFVLLFPLGTACYLFPVLSRFEMGVGALVSNCVKLAMVHLPSTAAMAVWLWLAQTVFLRWPVTFIVIPSLTALFQSLFLERIFAPYMEQDGGA